MFYIYANGKSIYQPMDNSLVLVSPKLTLEIGKAGSLQFTIPPSHQYYHSLQQLTTSISVEMDDTEIFRGRVLSNSRNFQNLRTVYCEGDLAYLVDSVQMGKRYAGKAHDLFRHIVAAHNARVEESKRFTVGSITVENRDVLLAGRSDDIEDAETGGFDYKQIALNSIADEWHTTFEFMEECLINPIGGYLRTRRSGATTYLEWLKDYESTAVQEIEFGKNLLDLTQEVSAEDVFTVLIPLGDENLTVASVNNGSDELVDEAAVARYGRIVKTHVFDSVNQPQTLLENGKRYLANHSNVPITITVRAVDMRLIDPNASPIRVGDRVRVRSIPHDVIDYLVCTKIEYDLENPANNTYTFGTPKQSMTERYRKDRSKQATAMNRSGRASGGAAGAAAETQAKKSLDKFYDAWVNPNAEAGTVSIYGIYHELKNSIAVLKNEIGIDINAPDGTLNLKNLRTECDEQGKALREQAAQINMMNNETRARLELIVANHEALAEKEDGHYAELILETTKLKSTIDMKADIITMNATEATINSKIINLNGKVQNLDAEIASVRKLVADEVDAMKGNVDWLRTKGLIVDNLYANNYVSAPAIRMGGATVATRAWVEEKLKDYAKNGHIHGWNTISGKPSTFPSASHRHPMKFSLANGHTHTVKVDGKSYTTYGVSTNSLHSFDGHTGYN